QGETSLLYGGRVSKANLHCEAYGATDETVSALGLARALSQDSRVRELLKELERDLFTVGAELATDPQKYDTFKEHFTPLSAEVTTHLEGLIDSLQDEVQLPRSFILPGASAASAAASPGGGMNTRNDAPSKPGAESEQPPLRAPRQTTDNMARTFITYPPFENDLCTKHGRFLS
ncbi:MAG: ATP:cob(I)alamin adenosyltransferase, partial [Planctomycetes bacterium]|nr:ATP:cob(I)alamin adenosyltransferase [Planctomycetota bacterium]